MSSKGVSYLSAKQPLAELTLRSIVLAIVLTILLAMSNAYLALKLGILTSASIPAAILSMGILRFFKNPTMLEHNAVQTAASAGEAIAGGIVYTVPALVIIGYWHRFDYITNVFIAALSGILGVLFSIPLRRILVRDKLLRFPEGQAIAEILKTSHEKLGVKDLILGGIIGSLLELFQVGFKLLANSWSYWFGVQRAIFGLGFGFSATMLGAGYLIGEEMSISIFIGALIAWFIALPLVSSFYPQFILHYPVKEAAHLLWNSNMRYLGIGGMLFAGIWTFTKLIKPLVANIYYSFQGISLIEQPFNEMPRTDRDIPLLYLVIGVLITAALLFLFFQFNFPLQQAGLDGDYSPSLVFAIVMYVLVIGFLFSVITAYFSGMVGVTASPGSSIVIAGILLAAWLLSGILKLIVPLPIDAHQLLAAEAITILIGSVVTGIAAIANDNTQDLKVGQLVGATPWKQQLMLLLGVIISSLVIPPVMQLLFNVYGIAGVLPHAGMDASQSLPAPTAALISAVTEAVFHHTLPWNMVLIGGVVILLVIFLQFILKPKRYGRLSILGVAIGMYLPLTTSFPLFLGGLMAMVINRNLEKKTLIAGQQKQGRQVGTLIACGLVAGSAIMDVLLAIPFSFFHNPDVLSLVSPEWESVGVILSLFVVSLLAWWINHRVCRPYKAHIPQ